MTLYLLASAFCLSMALSLEIDRIAQLKETQR